MTRFYTKILLTLLLAFVAPSAFGQNYGINGTIVGFGPELPTTCSPVVKRNVLYFKTRNGAGLYECKTANTWTPVGGGVSTGTPVTGGVADRVFFGATNGGLEQNANLSFNKSIGVLSLVGINAAGSLYFQADGTTQFLVNGNGLVFTINNDTNFYRSAAGEVTAGTGALATFGNLRVAASAYGAGWSGSQQVPTKGDLYTKIQTLATAGTTTSVTGTTVGLTAGNRFISKNNSTRVVGTLPATCTEGQTITVNGYGTAGWRISQNAGQVIHGNSDTTVGTGGYVQSQARYDSVTIVCVVTDNEWLIANSQGTLTLN